MSARTPLLITKPKLEIEKQKQPEENEEENAIDEDIEEQIRQEQEEALVALIEHRTKEVDHLRQRITYYKSELDKSEKNLEDTHMKLARLRGRDTVRASKNLTNRQEELRVEIRSPNPIQMKQSGENPKVMRTPSSPVLKNGHCSQKQVQSKPPLSISGPMVSQPMHRKESGNKISSGSGSMRSSSPSSHTNNTLAKPKADKARRISSDQGTVETQPKGTKRKLEETEHTDLIPLIGKSSSPETIRCQTGCLLPSQHNRKLRCLILCPSNDQLFATSALDGVVNLWQVQGRGSGASFLSSTDCQSDKRRWPEDIAWHPQGNKLFSVYTADGGGSQLSVLNLNGKEKARVSFLKDKPHTKGIINSITFTPWDNTSFVTGGSDHAVILWTDKDGDDSWKPKTLHKSHHSSAVMGVAGMRHKNVVMSAGADKRIIGFDVVTGRADYKHQIESKCMSVQPNPCDFNLFMVQTGTPERQLKLYDLRLRQMEIHAFGWKQESSESQSALINQAWSPDGLYMTSGSADPIIHIFDIRYNAHKPSQSIRAHHKRVFKAVWHHALPLLISISSDLNIGLHRVN